MNHPYPYKEADKYFVLNDKDISLTPIYISLPDPPEYDKIDGYGKEPEKQMFKRMKYPPKLKALEEKVMNELKQKEIGRDFKINGYVIYKEFWKQFNERVNMNFHY